MRYNPDNHLTSANKSGLAATLLYDPAGRLRQRTFVGINNSTAQSFYDGVNLVAEYDAANVLQRRFVHGPGVDEPLVQYEGATTANKSWFYADHQGSVVAAADISGTSTAIYSYGPFGEFTIGAAARFRYTGQQAIYNLGLYYYKARFYSPTHGKFLQTDPIGYADDLNLYAYVKNNPLNNTDPMGLYWFRQDWQIGYLVGRDLSLIVPGDPVSRFIENYVPAGRTLAELHDPLVDTAVKAGIPDWLANIPTMIPTYIVAVATEILRTVGILDQPAQPTQLTPRK